MQCMVLRVVLSQDGAHALVVNITYVKKNTYMVFRVYNVNDYTNKAKK